jgi:hypothetical protein
MKGGGSDLDRPSSMVFWKRWELREKERNEEINYRLIAG